MIFTTIKNAVIKAQKKAGYSRAAKQLLKLSDRQLEDFGFSRSLLKQGYKAYPWKEPTITHVITDNVTNIDFPEREANYPGTKKAA